MRQRTGGECDTGRVSPAGWPFRFALARGWGVWDSTVPRAVTTRPSVRPLDYSRVAPGYTPGDPPRPLRELVQTSSEDLNGYKPEILGQVTDAAARPSGGGGSRRSKRRLASRRGPATQRRGMTPLLSVGDAAMCIVPADLQLLGFGTVTGDPRAEVDPGGRPPDSASQLGRAPLTLRTQPTTLRTPVRTAQPCASARAGHERVTLIRRADGGRS